MASVADEAQAIVDWAYEDPAANAAQALERVNALEPVTDDDQQAMADAGETLYMLKDAVQLTAGQEQEHPQPRS
jgi:hypothetical protein